MRRGALSVITCGQPMMAMWPADNWDSLDLVCVCVCVCVCSKPVEKQVVLHRFANNYYNRFAILHM